MLRLYHPATWKIAVYGREHGVPHFHVEGRDFRCSISIETHALIIGTTPSPILKLPRDRASEHRAQPMVTWRELNE